MNLDRPDFLLFANLVFVWSVGGYFPLGEVDATAHRKRVVFWIRVVAILLVAWLIGGWAKGWMASLPMAAGAAALLALRERIRTAYLAELELLNAAVLMLTFTIIRRADLVIHTAVPVPAAANALPAALLVGAVVCYALRGGSYIVRGVLEKGALIPVMSDTAAARRVQHGRMIGYLERIIVIAAVTAGSFEALAFLMAAKSLIRAKELEQREFAEYFLVGSLCSTLVALLGGMAISWIVSAVPRTAWVSLFF